MRFRQEKSGRGVIINITTLIDVMFLLLIFFMVTSTFKNQPAINLVLPRSATATETVDTPSVLYLASTGEIYLNDTLVDESRLPELLGQLRASANEDRMVLRADESASHGKVVSLIDTIKQSGFTRVSLSARMPGGR